MQSGFSKIGLSDGSLTKEQTIAARSKKTVAENRTEAPSNSHLRMHVLASGSKGNATLIEDVSTGRALMVDCGISKRDFFCGCKEVDVNPANIEGILITHEHTDHTKGLGVVSRGLAKEGIELVLYTSEAIRKASREIIKIQHTCDMRSFSKDDHISIAGIATHVFATAHDAAESFGFRFEQKGTALGYMTDTGVVTPQAFEALQKCRILALESNYDTHMLETGSYPFMVKQRVASDWGHLSNVQAAEALERLLCGELEQVIAMHISENNNTYRMPQESLTEVIARNKHSAKIHSSYQHRIITVE